MAETADKHASIQGGWALLASKNEAPITAVAESIADQRDEMLAQGLSHVEIEEQLDFSAFEQRFTNGDEYVKGYYEAYFEGPFRRAAIKELSGEPMVPIELAEK